MSKKKYTAIILGSNGLIGSHLLHFLLKNEEYERVYAISRKRLDVDQHKLINIVSDIHNIQSNIQNIKADHFFCCIGTTKSKVSDNDEYFKIDHDYPLLVAKILKNNGCKSVSIISSIGANINSNNFYLKLKGSIEKSIIDLNYHSTQIFRPSLLVGMRSEKRTAESIMQIILPFVNLFLIGKMKDFRSIKGSVVASAMVNLTLQNKQGVHIYQTEVIKENA